MVLLLAVHRKSWFIFLKPFSIVLLKGKHWTLSVLQDNSTQQGWGAEVCGMTTLPTPLCPEGQAGAPRQPGIPVLVCKQQLPPQRREGCVLLLPTAGPAGKGSADSHPGC